MKTRIAINGFGRIGRIFFRKAYERKNELEIVAINDLGDPENLAYLLKYDSVYGRSDFNVRVKTDGERTFLVVTNPHGERVIPYFSQREPAHLPWKELDVDIAVEATGAFASYKGSQAHLFAGARRVVVTAPVSDEPVGGINGATVLVGVNEDNLSTCDISSNASCTTNAGSPIIAILNESLGIKKAALNTVHGYTASQAVVDSTNPKDFRRGRAAAINIVPSTTGAATATTKVITGLENRFDGIAVRVPVPAGSIVDITFLASQKTSVEEVNNILKEAARQDRWSKVFSVSEEPLVSSDILGLPYASIADLSFTQVVDGDLVKVLSWYDNEMGYIASLVEHVIKSGSFLER